MREMKLELGRAVRFTEGIPDISGLPCDVISNEEAGDYMARYYLEYTRERGLRFHHILASDPQGDLHNHPWDFVSVMLSGSYTEITPGGEITYEAPCVITRKAEHFHRLVLPAPVWTLVTTGPVKQHWGFKTARGFIPWERHFTRSTIRQGDTMETAGRTGKAGDDGEY